MLVAPGEQKDERHPDAYRAIGQIESRETRLLSTALHQVKPQKIHNVLPENAIHQIAHDASNHQAKGELAEQRVRVEMVPAEKKDYKRRDRDERQRTVFTGERTPRRPGVLPMHKLEKTGKNRLFIPDVRQKPEHDGLGNLVQSQNNKRNRRNSAVGRAQE